MFKTPEAMLNAFIEAGIIQFGHWIDGGQSPPSPIRLNLEMLPSYPHLLEYTSHLMTEYAELQQIQRLVCHQHSLALAICVSLQTGIPLVYERHNPAGGYSLVGAYDVGHPTMLIGEVYNSEAQTKNSAIKTHAARVGLNIVSELYVIGFGQDIPSSVQCLALINTDIIGWWVSQRWITKAQGNAIQRWVEQQQSDRLTHHQG